MAMITDIQPRKFNKKQVLEEHATTFRKARCVPAIPATMHANVQACHLQFQVSSCTAR